MSAGWTDAAVRAALGLGGREDVHFDEVSTDTRTLRSGSLYVALHGTNFDGHAFLGEAAAGGARGAVVDHRPADAPEELTYYVVPDTLAALGLLARHRRRFLGARVCAVTGTNGKTTTKEMIRAVLATRYRVHATEANLNNLVGVPLTILSAPLDTEALVVEAATNSPGEIGRLGAIIEPDLAVITGVAEAHLEGLGDLQGVLREKTSLLDTLAPAGLAAVADEPPALLERARAITPHAIAVGWTDRADPLFRAEQVRLESDGRVEFRWRGRDVALAFRGRPHARNALFALAAGAEWGVDADVAAAALCALQPPKLRSEIHEFGDLLVIADCYNSNPASLAAALDLLLSIPRRGGRVALVGTMRELGTASQALHARAAAAMADSDLDLVVATGEFVPAFADHADRMGDRLIRADDPLAAYDALAPRLTGDEVVLLKASRGVALERLLPRFEKDWIRPRRTPPAPDRGAAGRPAAGGAGPAAANGAGNDPSPARGG